MRVILRADKPESARDAIVQHLRQRIEVLKTSGRRVRERDNNARLARELELEMLWLEKIEFEPPRSPLHGPELNVRLNERSQ